MTTVAASIPVLRWAAQRARLHDEDLSVRFRKWPLWLTGEARPTLKQLEDFAPPATHRHWLFLPARAASAFLAGAGFPHPARRVAALHDALRDAASGKAKFVLGGQP